MRFTPRVTKRRSLIAAGLATVSVVATLTFTTITDSAVASAADAQHVDVASMQRLTDQQPLLQAATALQYVMDAEQYPNFAGIALGPDQVDVYWKGTLPVELEAPLANARNAAKIAVHTVQRSKDEKDAAADALFASAVADQSDIHMVKAPIGSDYIVAATEQPVRSLKSVPVASSGIEVRYEQASPVVDTARRNDDPPFDGGAVFANNSRNTECTLGYGVSIGRRNDINTEGILTAAHCGANGDQFVIPDTQMEITRRFNTLPEFDLGVMVGVQRGVTNRIYDGDANGQFFRSVVGYTPTFQGEYVCRSGRTTGTVCGLVNENVNVRTRDRDGSVRVGMVQARQESGGAAVEGGDSGGPVFSLAGPGPVIPNISQGLAQTGQVVAKGITSARSEINPALVFYQDFQTAFDTTGLVPVAGTSLRSGFNPRFCVDADLNTVNQNPTRAQLWDCNNSNQQYVTYNTHGDFSVRNLINGKCLDFDPARVNQNGTVVQWWSCNGGAQQRFNWTVNGELQSQVNLRKCIDQDLNTINRNGTRLQLWDCNGSSQQKWVK